MKRAPKRDITLFRTLGSLILTLMLPLAANADAVLLNSSSFWKSTQFPLSIATQIEGAVVGMPPRLKTLAGLDEADRALQLQWAVKAANVLSAAEVTLDIPAGIYNFTMLIGAHSDTPAGGDHRLYLPKLVVTRPMTLRGVGGKAVLTYDALLTGADVRGFAQKDSTGFGRVLLMIPSGIQGVVLESLVFRGNHSASNFSNPYYYVHENNTALVKAAGGGHYQYALLMIGLNGGPTHADINNCDFQSINNKAISIIGGATITHSTFTGIIPMAKGDFSKTLNAMADSIASITGPGVGNSFQEGISQPFAYGNLFVTHSTFTNLNEGIDIPDAGSITEISNNTFSLIADHAIYSLATAAKLRIVNNYFDRIYSTALKLGGRSTSDPLDPRASMEGPRFAEVVGNRFRLVRHSLIYLSGSYNRIENNLLIPYSEADPSDLETIYNPMFSTGDTHPHIWISTYGGNAGYKNHSAFNTIAGNRATSGKVDIFLQESDTAPDRSVGYNRFSGDGQQLYFASRRDSTFSPIVSATQGTKLIVGAPPYCADCYPGSATYRNKLNIEWMKSLRLGTANYLLLKYIEGNAIYLVGENGIHRSVGSALLTPRILAVADLSGDGFDEVYTVAADGTTIYGSQMIDPRTGTILPLAQWYFYQGKQQIIAATVGDLDGNGRQLFTAFNNSTAVYGSRIAPGDSVHRVSGTIYVGNGVDKPSAQALKQMAIADVSDLGHDELYLVFGPAGGNRILSVYSNREIFITGTVYNGTQSLELLTAARTHGNRHHTLYQKFSSTTIYVALPSGEKLPNLGSSAFDQGGAYHASSITAADLDGDGIDEIYTTFRGMTTIYGSTAIPAGGYNWFYSYNGKSPLLKLALRTDASTGAQSFLSLFSDAQTIYQSAGRQNNGSHYVGVIINSFINSAWGAAGF